MVFSLSLPKLSLSGAGAVSEAVEHFVKEGVKRPLIVTDENLISVGVLDGLFEALDKHNIEAVLFDQVKPNPTVFAVNTGLTLYKEQDCDSFIAVGGGSPTDCAKAIRILASNGGRIQDYNGVGLVKKAGDFFVAINTTAGTAAEMTSNSVITDAEKQVKMVIVDSKQIPDIAVNDPELMTGLPTHITAATGMDALTHAIEAYVSQGSHTLTKPMALEAIKLIAQWLPIAVDEGQNIEARTHLADAQFLAGMAFNSAGLGLVHAMAHQPGATHDLPHGVCNAILLPIVCRFNANAASKQYREIAQSLGGNIEGLDEQSAALLAVDLIKELSQQVGIPSGFSELGIERSDIEPWLDKAMNDVCIGSNPVMPKRQEVESLYCEAL